MLAQAVARADVEAVPRAKGAGSYARKTLKIEGDRIEEVAAERGTFTMAFSNKRSFIKFLLAKPVDGEWARIFINDGKGLMESDFNRRTGGGASGRITPCDEEGNFFLDGISPHYLTRQCCYALDRLAQIYPGANIILLQERGLYTVRVETAKDGDRSFTFDAAQKYRTANFRASLTRATVMALTRHGETLHSLARSTGLESILAFLPESRTIRVAMVGPASLVPPYFSNPSQTGKRQ